jgi:hypothetical protein
MVWNLWSQVSVAVSFQYHSVSRFWNFPQDRHSTVSRLLTESIVPLREGSPLCGVRVVQQSRTQHYERQFYSYWYNNAPAERGHYIDWSSEGWILQVTGS